ncbi:MAG TPA: prepilin-type N-terminal cleavage/methylation domain-containing protein [Candidatus Paceibacterota bacterium]|nr:prepilin-type N-terminal cleavage/methylation domain-containing protein [Candidatus Paceibacterota bacterium]
MKPANPSAGFSLIEVMVAILVLGIALVGLTQGISTALGSSKESELQTTAALFAAGQIEQLRAEGSITDKDTEGECGSGLELYRWKQSVAATRFDGLHEVTVIIESTRDGRPVYELKTLLFERPDDSADKKDSKKKVGGK